MFHSITTFAKLPKVELHLHLDCSLSFDVVSALVPGYTRQSYDREFNAAHDCHCLQDYLRKAEGGIRLMQNEKALRLVTQDLFKQLAADHVVYAEIRFAPLLHIQEGLSADEVVRIIEEATSDEIANTGIEARLILCTLRHFTAEQSLKTASLAVAWKGSKVVGLDIAGDEAGYPLDAHIDSFALARDQGVFVTAHAGEACGAESVRETLTLLKPSRLGHGVRSVEDEEVMNLLLSKKIHLEVCPSSNVVTHTVPSIKKHPIDRFYQLGISQSINTDGRALSHTSLTEEYQKLHQAFHWTVGQIMHCNREALHHAFVDDETKNKLLQKLESLTPFGKGQHQ